MIKTVHPKEIYAELEHIWESLEGTGKMRACLFNLVVFAKESSRIKYLHSLLQKVIEKFPCRILFVVYGENKKDISAKVSVLTAKAKEHHIVCDFIELEVSPSNLVRVPFIILPHLVPDLPVYLIYPEDPSLPNLTVQKLSQFASRIIFDSESACNLNTFAQAILEYEKKGLKDIADLNWARIENWRLLFASVFKEEEDLALLTSATELHISYNSIKTEALCHTAVQSIYLQGWLAAQLKWQFKAIEKENESLIFFYTSPYHSVKIFLSPSPISQICPGSISSIHIQAAEQTQISLKRNLNVPHQVIVEKESAKFCALPMQFPLEKERLDDSLVKEIYHQQKSEHYVNMLKLIKTIPFPSGL